MFAINTQAEDAGRAGSDPERRSPGPVAGNPLGLLLGFARRRWWLIALSGLLGLLLGAALGFLTPNRYSATSQLLIDPRDLRVLQNEISPQNTSNDTAVTYLESQVRVIGSDGVRRKVIERAGLAGDPDFGGPGSRLGALLGLPVQGARDQRDPVLLALAAMDKLVHVRRSERTFVIDITAVTGDGDKSARIANAMAEVYLEDQAAVRSDAAQRASNSLGARLNELRERVRQAEDKVERYRAANNLVGTSGKLVSEETLAVSNTQLAQARARTTDAQAKFDQVRAVRPSSIEAGATPEALQSAAIATLRGVLASALTREADALVLYGAQHPLLVSAQAQVRDARRQIAEELARTVQAARAELDRARASETSIASQVERLKRETLTTGAAAVQLRELEREADAHRQVYQAFLLRARETSEQTSVDSTNARVITSATAPLEKTGPNRKLFALAGLILGLGLGVALAILRDMMGTQRPQAAKQPAGVCAEPAGSAAPLRGFFASAGAARATSEPADGAAVLSAKPARGRWRGAATQQTSMPAETGLLTVILPSPRSGTWRKQPQAATSAFHGTGFATDSWDDPRSPLAAAVLAVRDRLILSETPGQNRKVVVLGLGPGVGTSLVALNLALASAREKATPLLIDLANGPASLSASFAADAALGAEDVISGAAGLIRAALQDDETGAFFLPRPADAARKPAPCPARLGSGLFDQTRRFDAVIIDGGSVMDGALPYILAELADDIVLVASNQVDEQARLRLMRRALGPDAEKVRVVVANQAAAG
ncbi:MAG: exopolysaccharide transport family protein [Hyphomicrobiales bacterium]|nr:exopolysaccharide transport family protein [Hyphomicrobiales bacterium]